MVHIRMDNISGSLYPVLSQFFLNNVIVISFVYLIHSSTTEKRKSNGKKECI